MAEQFSIREHGMLIKTGPVYFHEHAKNGHFVYRVGDAGIL